jgi:ribosome biogenesis GTPase
MAKKKKIRASFRKSYDSRTRQRGFTRRFHEGIEDDQQQTERISGKGELAKKRTVIGVEAVVDDAGFVVQVDVDESLCLKGRVLSIHGLSSTVLTEDGQRLRCATRGLLKTISTDLRHVVAVGDHVWIRPMGNGEGVIERVDPRRGVISRTFRNRQHVLVSNVDQLLIVVSAAQPDLKPNLIDRMLVTAEKSRIRPIICINKVDLVNPADLQPLLGVYGQMGYATILTSATTGFGLKRLKQQVVGQENVFAGQSGVGKSSLLNAIEEGLDLRVKSVSQDNQKGRHTTTAAQLIPLVAGGFIVDTPGIRQFQLWDVIPQEVEGYFRDIRPYINRCRFPDCTHTHEADCAVKDAVADGRLDARRYESYCYLFDSPSD